MHGASQYSNKLIIYTKVTIQPQTTEDSWKEGCMALKMQHWENARPECSAPKKAATCSMESQANVNDYHKNIQLDP